jgi:hypothetical protein
VRRTDHLALLAVGRVVVVGEVGSGERARRGRRGEVDELVTDGRKEGKRGTTRDGYSLVGGARRLAVLCFRLVEGETP